jgi:hypothetical protein
MAEQTVLLRVGIDQAQIDGSIKAIATAREELEKLTAANKELAITEGKTSEAFIKNEASIKQLNDTISTNQRVLVANEKIQKSNTTSIAAMRESVKRLTAQYVDLSETQRKGFEGTNLEISIKRQVEALKKLEEGIGQTSRNVGNYPKSIGEAIKGNAQFGKSFNGLAATIQSNPIGLLVTALLSLVGAFTKTQGATDAINKVFKPFGIILERVGGLISELAEKYLPYLTKAFENPKQAISDLVDFIKNNLINRLKAFGVIAEGLANLDFKKVANGVLQFGSGVENVIDKVQNMAKAVGDFVSGVIDEADKLIQMERELENAENALIVSQAKLNRQIEERRSLLEDENQLNSDRVKSGKEALGLIQQEARLQLSVLDKRIALAIANAKLNGIDRKEQFEINKLMAERDEILAASVGRTKDVRNQLTALQKSIDAAERDRLKKLQQAEEQREKDILDAERASLEARYAEEARLAEEQTRISIDELKKRFIAGQITSAQYEQEITDTQTATLAIRAAAIESQIAEVQAARFLADEERISKELELTTTLNAINDQARNIELENAKKAAAEQAALAKKVADSKIAALNAVLATSIAVFGAESTAGKLAASFGVLMSTYQGAARALKDYAAPYSYIVAAATGIQGALQIAKINSAPEPKFNTQQVGGGRRTLAEGGAIDIGGQLHSQGGTVFHGSDGTSFEAERGEKLFVVNRQSSAMLDAVQQVNAWGRSNRAALRHNYLADGGFVNRLATEPAVAAQRAENINNGLTDAIKEMNIVVRTTDIDRVNDEVKQARVTADL